MKISLFISCFVLFSVVSGFSQSSEEFFERGLTEFNKGNFEIAVDDFSQAVMLEPGFTEAFVARGKAYIQMKELLLSREDLTTALAQEPNHPEGLFLRGKINYQLNSFEDAVADLTDYIRLNNSDIDALFFRAESYFQLQDYQQAIKDYLEILKWGPERTDIYLNLGYARYLSGDTRGACQDWDTGQQKGNRNVNSFIHKYCN